MGLGGHVVTVLLVSWLILVVVLARSHNMSPWVLVDMNRILMSLEGHSMGMGHGSWWTCCYGLVSVLVDLGRGLGKSS
jgi:hypothetical protein